MTVRISSGLAKRSRLLIGVGLLLAGVVQGCAPAEGQTLRERIADRRGSNSDTGTLQLMQMTYQGIERSYYVHVPAALQGQTGLPAVMMFHGGEGNGTDAASASNLAAAADASGFVALFPNSPGQQWNDGRATTRSGVDDVGFARALIGQAASLHGVSPNRVFAAGISNGGMFVQRLACEATGAFRGYAVAAANMPADLVASCNPSGPVPMIFFNGAADRLMPFEGGDIASMRALGIGVGGTVLSTAQTQEFWSREAGCSRTGATQALPDRANDGTTVTLREAAGCTGGAVLDFYVIQGGGHTWPGNTARSTRIAGVASQDISATAQMISFFSRFGL